MQTVVGHGRAGEGTLKYYAEKLVIGMEWKLPLSVVGTLVSMMEGFYSPMLWGFLSLFILDLISGIWKSKKLGVAITSKRLRSSVNKLGGYMVLITSLLIASKYETSLVPFVTCTYYYFMFTEFKSIIENVQEMGVRVPYFLKSKVSDKIDDIDPLGNTHDKKKEEGKDE